MQTNRDDRNWCAAIVGLNLQEFKDYQFYCRDIVRATFSSLIRNSQFKNDPQTPLLDFTKPMILTAVKGGH